VPVANPHADVVYFYGETTAMAMNSVRLAVDVESGDYGPRVILSGIIEARRTCNTPFSLLLCGNGERIEQLRGELDPSGELGDVEIVACNEVVDPAETRAAVWKKKQDAAIIRCISLQKEGRVDASISAGDTAILMGAALFILGRSEGALRPALAAFLPTARKKPVLLLDVGANCNCRADHLVSFAQMGEQYVSRFCANPSPAVALLSIGKEAVKGTSLIFEAEAALKGVLGNYIGFVEGNDVLAGEADVVVCDGFCGNVLLKACESFHELLRSVIGEKMDTDGEFKKKLAVLDPDNYGAVPFLGIKGTVLKAHGRASARAIANAVHVAIAAVHRSAVGETVRPKGNLDCG
jgi:phosphate acyltransferase